MYKILMSSIIAVSFFIYSSPLSAQMYVSRRDAMKYHPPSKSQKINKIYTSSLYQTTPGHHATAHKKHLHRHSSKYRNLKGGR